MNLTSVYKLRGFEQSNPSDVERMNLMYYHPEVMKAKGYFKRGFNFAKHVDLQESDMAMFNILSTILPEHKDVSYGVVDHTNELVGWIWFYLDKSHPLPVGISKRLGLTPQNSRIYQVSYEKLMSEGWPAEILAKIIHTTHASLSLPRKGVIVEGLSLAISKMTNEYRKLFSDQHKLVLYGYVHAHNPASQIVLMRNGFLKEKRKYRYDGSLHDLWVKII